MPSGKVVKEFPPNSLVGCRGNAENGVGSTRRLGNHFLVPYKTWPALDLSQTTFKWIDSHGVLPMGNAIIQHPTIGRLQYGRGGRTAVIVQSECCSQRLRPTPNPFEHCSRQACSKPDTFDQRLHTTPMEHSVQLDARHNTSDGGHCTGLASC